MTELIVSISACSLAHDGGIGLAGTAAVEVRHGILAGERSSPFQSVTGNQMAAAAVAAGTLLPSPGYTIIPAIRPPEELHSSTGSGLRLLGLLVLCSLVVADQQPVAAVRPLESLESHLLRLLSRGSSW